jgi:DHA2 family methylenomycin A resistance protein-like MFS transporter
MMGLYVFAFGSALCTVAKSLPMLIAACVLQGLGAAWLMPCSLALIAHTFPDAHARRRALAIWGGASGIGLASGPVLGGVLTSAISWRAIFLVNVPVAAVAGLLLVRHVEETRRHQHDFDIPGQCLVIASLSALTGGFIVAGQRGWALR